MIGIEIKTNPTDWMNLSEDVVSNRMFVVSLRLLFDLLKYFKKLFYLKDEKRVSY